MNIIISKYTSLKWLNPFISSHMLLLVRIPPDTLASFIKAGYPCSLWNTNDSTRVPARA